MKTLLFYLIQFTLLLSKVNPLMSQESGELDSTFNFDGISTFNNGGDKFYDITIQNDGKILVMSNNDLYSDSILIARFNIDGSIDNTFGQDGFIQTFGSGYSVNSDGHKIISQVDGTIFTGCNSRPTLAYQYITIAKFTADGSPDSTFDFDGVLYETIGTSNTWFQDLVIQPDGKILVSAFAKIDIPGFLDFGPVFCRYLADGSPDSTFGLDGKLFLGDILPDECPESIILTPEGKIIVMTTNLILQLLPNGEFDDSFGLEGIVTVDIAHKFNYVNSEICRNYDGTIYISGVVDWTESSDLYLYKYSFNGEKDLLFGDEGVVLQYYFPGNIPKSLIMQPDGKILLLSKYYLSDDDYSSLLLTRFYQNGIMDTVFGDSGKYYVTPGWHHNIEVGTDLVVQPDNKILICGYFENDTINEGRIWRIIPELELLSTADHFASQNCIVFPNPTSDVFFLKTDFYIDENYPLSLVDQQGRFIKNLIPIIENDITEKTYRLQLPDNLPIGIYFITFQNRSQKFSVQFVTK